jgi:hypothetical protein
MKHRHPAKANVDAIVKAGTHGHRPFSDQTDKFDNRH